MEKNDNETMEAKKDRREGMKLRTLRRPCSPNSSSNIVLKFTRKPNEQHFQLQVIHKQNGQQNRNSSSELKVGAKRKKNGDSTDDKDKKKKNVVVVYRLPDLNIPLTPCEEEEEQQNVDRVPSDESTTASKSEMSPLSCTTHLALSFDTEQSSLRSSQIEDRVEFGALLSS